MGERKELGMVSGRRWGLRVEPAMGWGMTPELWVGTKMGLEW